MSVKWIRAALLLVTTIVLGALFGGLSYTLDWPLWATITGASIIGGLFGFFTPVIRQR